MLLNETKVLMLYQILIVLFSQICYCLSHMHRSEECAIGKERCCPSDPSWLKFDGYTDIVQNCLSVNSCIDRTIPLCTGRQGMNQEQNTIDTDSGKQKFKPWEPEWYEGCKKSCLEHHVHRRACIIWCSFYHKKSIKERKKEEHQLVLTPEFTVVGRVHHASRFKHAYVY